MKFSVILLMYNSSLQQTLLTVKSIVLQQLEEIELIIADDSSERNWKDDIIRLCRENKFYRYKFADSKMNVGTVKNILRALKLASGTYIKVIGAGDLLWDKVTLKNIYDKMVQENAKCAFCDFRGYAIDKKFIVNRYFAGPFNKKPYLLGKQEMIKKNMIVFSDYILGATFFYERNYLENCLNELDGVVKYAEDLAQVIVALNNERILYIPENHIIYEVGSGISTSKGGSSRMKLDAEKFENEILLEIKDPVVAEKQKRSRKIESKGRLQIAIMKALNNPIWYLRNFRRAHIRYERKKNLGFLDQQEFIQEFGFLRR